jgi:hypothetical protein
MPLSAHSRSLRTSKNLGKQEVRLCVSTYFFPIRLYLANPSMAGSDSSVRGGNHGDAEPPISRVEMRNMANSLVEAMERMLDERLPAARR